MTQPIRDRSDELHYCRIELHDRKHVWSECVRGDLRVWTKGAAALNGESYHGTALCKLIADHLELGDRAVVFGNLVQSLNGSFVIVVEDRVQVLAAVDRVRSIPLFYAQHENELVVSDDANQLRYLLRAETPDDFASKEFLLTGFVTGDRTLFKEIRQLQAGEYLHVSQGTEGPSRCTTRYYRYLHDHIFSDTREEMIERLDATVVQVFERLVDSTRDNTLIVPLSGGYDSRLVISMLKRLGVERVVCFAYGPPNNWEVKTSREIAAKLGYEWHFVPYSRWRGCHWPRNDEPREYFRYADGLCASPHVQDWMAVRELDRRQVLPKDGVMVPGHTGDFISGSRFPKFFASKDGVGEEELLNSILQRHYSLWIWREENPELERQLKHRILDNLPPLPLDRREDIVNAFECWEWQERQAKHIVHSLRVYDFYGYRWRIPLWDHALLDFFCRVPFEWRLGAKLYKEYLEQRMFPELGINNSQLADHGHDMPIDLFRSGHSILPKRWAKRAFRARRRLFRMRKARRRIFHWMTCGYPLKDRLAALRHYRSQFGMNHRTLYHFNHISFLSVATLGDLADRYVEK